MQKALPSFLTLLLVLLLGTSVRAQTFDLSFNLASARRMNIVETAPRVYDITTTGNDPFVSVQAFMPGPYDPEAVYVISFDYEAANGLDDLEIFYGAVNAARKASWTDLAPTNGSPRTFKAFMKFEVDNWNSPFQALRFDISKIAGADITISNLQLREPTATEVIPLNLNVDEKFALTAIPQTDGSINYTTNGLDPWIATDTFPADYDPNTTYVLQYTRRGDALDDFRVFFGEPWTPARMALFGPLPAAPTREVFTGFMSEGDADWVTAPVTKLRFDLGRQAGKTGNLKDVFLREPTQEESKQFDPPVFVDTVLMEFDVTRTSGGLDATELADGSYEFNTSGNDPWIRTKAITDLYDIDTTYFIEFEYQAAEAYNELEIFFGPPINGTQKLNAGQIPAAGTWTKFIINPKLLVDNFQDGNRTDFRFDFGRAENADKQILVRNLMLRPPTAAELVAEENSDKFVSRAANEDFLQYLATDFPETITSVVVDSTQVTISGGVTGPGPYSLAEVDPESYGFNQDAYPNATPLTVTNGEFSLQLPRYAALGDRQKDRIYARWIILNAAGEKASALTWATDVTFAAENNLAEEKSASIKGLDGLTPGTFSNFQDLVDLDIKSMKINLLLNGVFAANPASPTAVPYEFNGKTYYINSTFVNNLDVRIKACTDAGIKTSLVLLIPIRFANPLLDSIFTHPDANLGIYSMANVTDARGVEHYTMLIDYLARRYSRPDGLYGRMDQWIIHNEVDAHTEWTHAGQKPVELYTQIYDRSMRLVHYTIRKHNPTAKVFSSFTKHFNSKVGGANGPNFRSKRILAVLNDLMGKEKDYEWGIGWHSYPTNLRNPAVWNDNPGITPLNFNAAQITPRNLEMIDAYVRQQNVLYNGKKVRTILLSENGFSSNTADNPTFTQERQAAAVAYFWKKTDQRLPAIENIQYHRWVDNPLEGNLLFGLWTVTPGTVQGFNEKKPSWFVWEAAGTANEDAVFDPYKSVIGISDWSDIQFSVPTETTPHRVFLNVLGCDDDLADVLVSFNGEFKIPQADGTVDFYNVASNVPQPLFITKGGVLLLADTLDVSEDLELNFDLQSVNDLTATGVSSSSVALHWGAAAGAGFVVEQSTDGGITFSEIARVDTTYYLDNSVSPGLEYTYRVALELDASTLSCYSDPVTVTAPFIVPEYRNGDRNRPTNNKIAPQLRLRNDGDSPAAISAFTVRYWFTAENLAPLNFWVDYAALGTNDVNGTFVNLSTPREGADHYLEMSFATNYQIPANGNTGVIKTRITKADWTDFDETDDWSVADNGSYLETNRITVYQNGELIWGEEPTETPVVEALEVRHKNKDAAGNNNIKPELNLINTGNVALDYSALTLRYWFTPEGSATVVPNLDYAVLGAANITRQVVDAGNLTGGTRYLEVGFDPGLGQLGAGSETGSMKFRLHKTNWSSFDETDDHSYLQTGNTAVANAQVTAYLNGVLVWGTEPVAAPPAAANIRVPEQTVLADPQARLAPNPASTYTDLRWPGSLETVKGLSVLDMQGRVMAIKYRRLNNGLRLQVDGLPAGVYLLRGEINGTSISRKLVIH